MTDAQRVEYMRIYRKEHREQINKTRNQWRQLHLEQNKEINRRAALAFRKRQARKYWEAQGCR